MKTFAEEILIALRDPLYYRGTASEKRARAIELIKLCKVMCVIFDEFQHFLDDTRHVKLAAVADWLKTFINEVKIPCVLVGLPRCAAVLDVNEQLRRRFSARLSLPAFSIDTKNSQIQFRQLLNEIDKALPLDSSSGLGEVDTARRIYFASNGLIGYARKLITDAFEKTLIENRSRIQMDILENSFNDVIWQSPSCELNPFNVKFVFRKLDRLGEPFAEAVSDVRERKRPRR